MTSSWRSIPATPPTLVAGSRRARTRFHGAPVDGSRRRVVLALAGAVVALLSLGACGSASPDLAGKTYTSTQVTGHDLVPGSAVTLAFADGRVSAQAGCNTMNGPATWDGGKLVVAVPMASTMMACDDALMAQDQWLGSFLTSSPALTVEGDTLTLGDTSSGMTLTAQT